MFFLLFFFNSVSSIEISHDKILGVITSQGAASNAAVISCINGGIYSKYVWALFMTESNAHQQRNA